MALSASRAPLLLMCWFASLQQAVSFSIPAKRSSVVSSLYMQAERSWLDRRGFLMGAALTGSTFLPRQPAQARGWVQFPCVQPLGNTYHFLRAGESLLEADGIWSTNPLFLTNREAALSEKGIQQVQDVCRYFEEHNVTPTIVMYSLASSAMDTASIMGRDLKMGRDRLVPEFTYLDPRAVGRWDMLDLERTQAAVWAMDQMEAGPDGKGARPPPHEDSTPNETLANQSTRLRQLVSLMETQYSGDTVVLVFPDSTGPALLSAMIAGIPFNRVHELEFKPGEVRFDVTRESTLALLKEKEQNPTYTSIVEEGKQELARLRAMNPADFISVKDQMLEDDRLEMEQYQKNLDESRRAKERRDAIARQDRAKQVEADRQRRREEGDGDGISPFVPIIGAAAIGGAILFNANNGDEQVNVVEQADGDEQETAVSSQVKNTTIDLLEAVIDEPIIGEAMSMGSSGLGGIEEELTAIEVGIGATVHARINGDRKATFPPPVKPRDPVKAAEQAMKEYMDMDDGGRDWLLMMSDLMLEEDDDDMESQSP